MSGADIASDTAVLLEVITRLQGHDPLHAWSSHAQGGLALALSDAGAQRIEADKARFLKRHLFADLPAPAIPGGDVPARWAERIRADLPGIVAFGSGCYLVDPEALARAWQPTAR